jgi:phosphoglycerate dehydrogenase-like enzyme
VGRPCPRSPTTRAPSPIGRVLVHTRRMRALLLYARPDELHSTLAACDGAAWDAAATPEEVAPALERHRPEVVFSIKHVLPNGDGLPAPHHRQALIADGVRWFHVGGSGIEHLGAWDPEQTTLTSCAGVLAPFLAERALAGLLHLSTGHHALVHQQRERAWAPSRFVPVSDKTLLIVGLGHCGSELARRARALGMRVIATRQTPAPHPDADEVHPAHALDDLLPRADVLSLHVRLSPSTMGLIDARRLGLLPAGALVLNSARGPVIDEAALLEALDREHLGGAYLDVFATEPLPVGHPLWRHERVLVTPHCADQVHDWPVRFAQRFVDNWQRRRRGEPLLGVVQPS